ncbi:COX15/CtaA family protein [Urbifossiella limnaea]|uniref:Heme A synthase n=1 Tax=Urbifossiella limnaea TaxID=2528023 RepID=A0A517Y0P7_9BACT|nr:hypothetical protein [Urbifossiella limnaea]QDU23327.1 Heme A synthase [Urbifossiella limnaea]
MTDTDLPPRPVPRWLHRWAVATVCACLALLAVGQLVTSFRVGMADPIWPTSPWHLVNNYEPSPGYLIEHAHRILGFLVGGLVTVLALGVWGTHPNRAARYLGLVALAVLVGAFGEFHRALIAQRESTEAVVVPERIVFTMLGALAVAALLAGGGLVGGGRGSVARFAGLLGLVFVMIQGLLGGFRVKLNELVGTDLAAVHGVFGQVTFAVLLTVAVLTARPPAGDVPDADRRRLGRLGLGLVAVLFVQLVWGAWVRHAPDALGQRLHFLTAFVAVATAVWLLRLGFTGPARPRVRVWGTALGVLVALQVTLGVEAWMGKFGGATLPEFETVSAKQAGIRTAHALVGTGVLAAAVGLALRVRAGGER